MIFIYILILILFLILFLKFCDFFCINFPKFKLNPSALYTFYGAPGSGKSTLAAYFAKRALASGITVYSNLPINGCLHFEKDDLGKYLMENCLVIWDEVGVDANSRNFINIGTFTDFAIINSIKETFTHYKHIRR